jgi:hypothetical protein
MTSPNFVTDSAGWSLDHLGNLEANDGKFRGAITASSMSASSISGGTITGTTITGGTIQTSTTGHRVVMEGSTDDITFFNADGDETIILDGAGTSAAYSQMSVGGGIYLSNDVVADYQYGTEIYSGSGAGTAFVIHPIGNGEDEYFFFNSNGTMVTDADITAGELHADNGDTGSFTTADLKTVTVVDGIITNIS